MKIIKKGLKIIQSLSSRSSILKKIRLGNLSNKAIFIFREFIKTSLYNEYL